eukprot:GFYU01000302.1.p2 GENE.GFYU01000302.1~~GFYU01000302.1.p2  ORF type:complete len:155 (+),score=52.28 GFYU01000302.1:43-465(+)
MASGVGIAQDCHEKYTEIQLKHAHRFIVFKIDGGQVVVDKVGSDTDMKDYQAMYESFRSGLNGDECRYGVFDVEKDTDDGKRNKLCFIFWSPETAKIKDKMIYASTKESFKKALQGLHKDIQANDPDDIRYESVEAAAFS